jgi:hypothetical protein
LIPKYHPIFILITFKNFTLFSSIDKMAKAHCDKCDRTFKNSEALEHHNSSKHITPKAKTPVNTKKIWGWLIGIIVLAGILALVILPLTLPKGPGEWDTFAQCITDSGAKEYGAYWCPNCANQKKLFGNSFSKVNYIECSLPNRGGQNAECNAAGIDSYPTWEFKDGSRLSGYQSLQILSDKTGCPLVKDILE